MIKLIVKYKTQKWVSSKYIYPEVTKLLTFTELEKVTNENIESAIDGWVEILDIKQIVV